MTKKKPTIEELQREISFLKQENLNLKNNKKISDIIANNTSNNIAIVSFDLKTEYLYVSPSVKEVLGYEPSELLGKSFFDFVHPDDKYKIFKLLKKYIHHTLHKILNIKDSSLYESIEYRYKGKNGEWHELQSTLNFVGKNILAITRDISEQKKKDKIIMLSEANLKSLINQRENAIWSIDTEYRYVIINDYFKNTYYKTYHAKIKKGNSAFKGLSNDMISFWKIKYDYALAGETVNFEFADMVHNRPSYFDVTLNPIFTDKKISGVSCFSTEITEKKINQGKIEASEKRYRLLFDSLPFGGEVIDKNGIIIKCSPNTAKMLGFTIGEIEGKHIITFLDGTTKQLFKKSFPRIFSGEVLNFEVIMIHKDGHKIHVLRAANPIYNSQGNITSVLTLNIDITDRKLAEKRLETSKNHFKELFENAPIPLWEEDFSILLQYLTYLKKNGINDLEKYLSTHPKELKKCVGMVEILNVNSATLQLHQANTKEELLGSLDKIFTQKSLEAFIHEIISLFNGENSFETEAEVKTLKGETRQIILKLFIDNCGENKLIGRLATVDITQKNKDELEIKKLSILAEQSSTIIAVANMQGNLEYTNKKFTETTGYTFDEVKGKNSRILKSGLQDDSYYAHLWSSISSGKTWKGEFQNKKKNGDLYWEKATIFPLYNTKGEIFSYSKESEDITEKKAIEQELKTKSEELESRNIELDAFSHTVAHDLKNPIGTILGFTEIIKEEYSDFSKIEIIEYINAIERSAKKSHQIINSLLFFAGVRESEIKKNKVDLKIVLNESLERLSLMIEEYRANITYEKKWPNVYGTSQWIEEVLVNYISNAIKYGGFPPNIKIGHTTIKKAGHQKDMLKIWVKDDGMGISKDDQKKVFGKFERLKEINAEGHGLGLSIVARIIGKLGGQVGLESKLGKGSRFYFTLPLYRK